MPFDGGFFARPPVAPRRGWRARLADWRRNHSARQALDLNQRLDPRFARDIGLTQTELAFEVEKPFWKPPS
ncbi:MAG: hypothetical protein FJX54_00790 [Alphaproteobacteria bacterium]|nr:hypothetical protein [Alphaproteobacteria bacterium]